MLCKTISGTTCGLEGRVITVEVDIAPGLPQLDIVGQPDLSAREARERVRSAIRNAGYEFPLRRITVNLAPGDVRKEGTSFDLAIAAGVLASSGQATIAEPEAALLLAELALDGSLRPVRGVLPVAAAAARAGLTRAIVHRDNLAEVRATTGLVGRSAARLVQAIELLQAGPGAWQDERSEPEAPGPPSSGADRSHDISVVRGLARPKRAVEIAASGGHHMLLTGPPGAGKTMLARALPGLLPALDPADALEVSVAYSVAGLLPPGAGVVATPPFRSPHHSVSLAGLIGSARGRPGEVSLAHRGVLFLDELPEFRRDALEALRQPLEEGVVNLSRAGSRLVLPARFQMVGATNPCPCGLSGSGACTCSPAEIRRYRHKVSGPILDRIDIQVEVPRQDWEEATSGPPAEDSATVARRVEAAKRRQVRRNHSLGACRPCLNASLEGDALMAACSLDAATSGLFASAFDRLRLSLRSAHKVLRVARTMADMEESPTVRAEHITEAISYRMQWMVDSP